MASFEHIPPRRKKTGKLRRAFVTLMTMIILACLAFLAVITLDWYEKLPNTERVQPDFGGMDKPIFMNGEMQGWSAMKDGEGLFLPLEFLMEQIDPYIHYEEATQSVIITTEHKVIRLRSGALDALMNNQPFDLRFPVMDVEGKVFLPVEPTLELYGIQAIESAETGAVILLREGDIVQRAVVRNSSSEKAATVPMRTEPTVKAPIAADLAAGATVYVHEDPADAPGWLFVQLDSGYTGYIKKDQLRMESPELIPVTAKEPSYVPWKPLGGKINLTWEQVIRKTADPSGFGEMPGLNVVSPTWFSLGEDSKGVPYVINLADKRYVQWAHERGYQVWALFSNSFDPDLTTKSLASFEYRQGLIQQLVGLVEMYDLQGINIDFENVYLADKDHLTQFVREMTPYLHEAGAVVSIDVTIRDGSDMWSRFADRKALGEVVDYMMVMTYDEHWASSPVAGSVASLPWVEKGIVDIMEKDFVPPEKLLLGVPFYTYEWTEEPQDGKVKVSSKARFMKDVQAKIEELNLEPVYLPDVGQNYVEYKEGDKKVRIWIEDAVSMQKRAELVKQYDLAGIASWRRGFETPDIWQVIKDTLEQRP